MLLSSTPALLSEGKKSNILDFTWVMMTFVVIIHPANTGDFYYFTTARLDLLIKPLASAAPLALLFK